MKISLTGSACFLGIVASAPWAAANVNCPSTAQTLTTPYWGPGYWIVNQRRDAVVEFRTPGGEHGCTGTLIAPNLVLTASHCVGGSDGVSVGSGHQAGFFYEIIDGTNWNTSSWYSVAAIVEEGIDFRTDYAIIALHGNPAADLGITPTPLRAYVPGMYHAVTTIGHPTTPMNWDYDPRPKTVTLHDTAGTWVSYVAQHEPWFYGTCTAPYCMYPPGRTGFLAIRSTGYARPGSSGSGVLDFYDGGLVAVAGLAVSPANCWAGSLPIADLVHVSPTLRSMVSGVTLRAQPKTTPNARISVSCGPAGYEQCMMTSATSADFQQLINPGCSISCPVGATVTIRCEVLPGSQGTRIVQDIEGYKTDVDQVGISWVTSPGVYNDCGQNPYDCTRTVVADKPIVAYCDYED